MTLGIEVIGFCEGVALAEKGGVPQRISRGCPAEKSGRRRGNRYRAPRFSMATFRATRRRQSPAKECARRWTRLEKNFIAVRSPSAPARQRNDQLLPRHSVRHHDVVTVYEVLRRLWRNAPKKPYRTNRDVPKVGASPIEDGTAHAIPVHHRPENSRLRQTLIGWTVLPPRLRARQAPTTKLRRILSA